MKCAMRLEGNVYKVNIGGVEVFADCRNCVGCGVRLSNGDLPPYCLNLEAKVGECGVENAKTPVEYGDAIRELSSKQG